MYVCMIYWLYKSTSIYLLYLFFLIYPTSIQACSMQTFIMLCIYFIYAISLNLNCMTILTSIVQFCYLSTLSTLGSDKWIYSLMRNILLIWSPICWQVYYISVNLISNSWICLSYMKNLMLELVYTIYLCWVYISITFIENPYFYHPFFYSEEIKSSPCFLITTDTNVIQDLVASLHDVSLHILNME